MSLLCKNVFLFLSLISLTLLRRPPVQLFHGESSKTTSTTQTNDEMARFSLMNATCFTSRWPCVRLDR